MELVAVRRAKIVDESLVVEPNRIDHERVTLIMPHRFAVPGWFWVGRMWHVQIYAPHIIIVLRNHRDLLRCLNEEHRLRRGKQKRWDPGRPATSRTRPHRLAGKHI